MGIELSDNEDNSSRDKLHPTTIVNKILMSSVGDDNTHREGSDSKNKKRNSLSSMKGSRNRDGRDEIVLRNDRGSKCLIPNTGTTSTITGVVLKSGCSTPETIDLSPIVFKNSTMMITPPFRRDGGGTTTNSCTESSDDGSAETEPILYYQRRGRFLVWPVDQNIVRISGQNF